MKTNSLKLLAFATGIALVAQSCSGPTYVQSSPPPVYTQAPPPPPQQYVEQQPTVQTYSQPQQEEAPPPITYQTYYNELSPYGQWVNTPEYGNVWVPSAGANFQPYGTAGHWVLTNYGWTWVSDYSWGWAPFHYGRWEFDGLMGWYWIPGYEWSPAWVSWRSTPGYYGWAPLGPNYVEGGYATYSCPPERYVFVNATYINNTNISTYYEPRSQCGTYYSRSSVVSNTYYDRGSNATYYAGPQREEVERYTGTPVRPVPVVSSTTPERTGAGASEVRMFRPTVQQPGNNPTLRPAPEKVYQKADIAPIVQRPVLTQPNQPRAIAFKPENVRPINEQQNKQQPAQQEQRQQQPAPQQQKQPVQQPAMQQPAQPEQRQQQPAPQQQRQPIQQPAQEQHPAIQQPAPQQQRQPIQQPAQQRQQAQPQQQKPAPQQQRQQQPQRQQQQKAPKAPKPQKQQPGTKRPSKSK